MEFGDAIHRYLDRSQVEVDWSRWRGRRSFSDEADLGEVSDWGPVEDWTEWDEATG